MIKRSKKLLAICVVMSMSVCFCSVKAFSQGNISLGPLDINLLLNERIEIDDNIYRVSGKNGDKNSDVINIWSPGLGLSMPLGAGQIAGEHNVNLNWHSDFKNYRDNADQNQQNHYINAGGTFKFPRGFSVTLNDSYVDTWESAGSDRDVLHPRIENTGSVKVSLPDYFRKFDVDLTYENYDQDYDERALERANRNEHRFTINVPFKLTRKITLFPEYTFGITNIERETRVAGDNLLSDSHFSRIYGGARWQATAKTSGVMKIGYVNRDFETARVSDIKTLTYLIGIASDLTSRTSVLFNFTRSDEISEFTTGSNGYIRTRSDFTLTHTIKNFTGSLSGYFAKSVFRDSSRKDDDYKIGGDISYAINDWSAANIGYSYKDRHSNFDVQSDRINKMYIGVNLSF